MTQPAPDDEFRRILTGEDPGMARFRNAMRHVPSSPRCKLCAAPFEGVGGAVFRHFGFGRFPGNPAICANCIKDFRKKGLTGAEIQVSLLFADVRGSTGIAEGMRPAEFRSFLDGFYRAGSEVILGHDGLVDKLVGDEIIGLFFGGITGRDNDAAIELIERTDPAARIGERRNHGPGLDDFTARRRRARRHWRHRRRGQILVTVTAAEAAEYGRGSSADGPWPSRAHRRGRDSSLREWHRRYSTG